MAPRAGVCTRRCALCGRSFQYEELQPGPHFPFCSSRCKAVDLGNWVTESYGVEERDVTLGPESSEKEGGHGGPPHEE